MGIALIKLNLVYSIVLKNLVGLAFRIDFRDTNDVWFVLLDMCSEL